MALFIAVITQYEHLVVRLVYKSLSVEYCNKTSNLKIHELPKTWTRMKCWIVKFKIDIAQNLSEHGLPKSWTQHS